MAQQDVSMGLPLSPSGLRFPDETLFPPQVNETIPSHYFLRK